MKMDKTERRPKIIVADLDGTMVDAQHTLTPRMAKVLERLHQEGVILGIASGRPVKLSMNRSVSLWNLSFPFDFVIGMNGGELYDEKTGEMTETANLKKEYVREVLELMKPFEDRMTAHVYWEKGMLVTRIDRLMAESVARNGVEGGLVTLEEIASKDREKLMFRGEPDVIEEAAAYAKQFDCEHYRSFRTQPIMLEFQNPCADKGQTLTEYYRRYGFAKEDVWAFGDTTNDNGLLEAAGLGVCMANGTSDTKELADMITLYDNDHDGMARFIERYYFREESWRNP